MDRREAMTAAGILALAALSNVAVAKDLAHDHHHAQGNAFLPLANAAADCVGKGQACINHCLDLLGQGNKEMAACARSVNQMLAVCTALENLANQESKHVAALSQLAMTVCADCEKECRKHATQHPTCKACADSCANCARQCKSFAA